MPVFQRRILATQLKGALALGALTTADGVLVALPNDTPSSVYENEKLIQTGRGVLVLVPEGSVGKAEAPELGLFKGRTVLVALRNGETPSAAAEWIRYHELEMDVSGALIFNRARPGSDSFANDLADLLGETEIAVAVIDAETPLGRKGAPDQRDASLAPAVRTNVVTAKNDPWHAPLAELTLYELLRHRFLASAKAVALLDISDHLLSSETNVFETAIARPGEAIPLLGSEIYPWRLRQKCPAPFGDHIAKRRGEPRRLLSWCAAPQMLPKDCIWQPGRPVGAAMATTSAPFVRALGIVYPGAAVDRIVKKSDLTEDPKLVALSQKHGHKPIRLPVPDTIPKRPENGSVTVVSVMKNEGPFVLDWIAHNRAIGVDRFLVYTNDCDDGTDRMLDLLVQAGVTRRDNPFRETGQNPQYAAFSAAERENDVTGADWILTLDVDEYINIHAGDGYLRDLFNAVPDAHVISMPWRLFGNADQDAYQDRPVTELFTKAAPNYMPRPYQAWAFKTVYRNAGLFKRLGVHRPKGVQGRLQDSIRWVAGSGQTLAPEVWRRAWRVSVANWGYDLVTLNHYAVRSAESFLVKRDRGRVNHVHQEQDEAYWFRMNHNVEEDKSIQRLAPKAEAEKAALLALPGVAEAHKSAVAWHKTKIETLKARADMSAFYEQITSSRMQALSRLGPHFGMSVFMQGPHVVPDDVIERLPGSKLFFTLERAVPTK